MSHSRELNRGSALLSKKIFRANINGGPLAAKALYDDVNGGPPEFGVTSLSPRPEDYSEIFGSFHASRASSIPILDLPALHEKEVFFDVRSSGFDYAEVFGGFDCLDFAVTYEELTRQSNEGDGDSSEEAWTPAGTESLSDDSDHSTKLHCVSNGDSNLPFEHGTEFSISYNQAYQIREEDMLNGITHVTQVNEVPAFTYLVDGVNSQGQDDENQPFHGNDDGYFNIDLGMGFIEGKQTKKIVSQPPNAIRERLNFGNGPQTTKGNAASSHLDESFITISEISLRTEPSQVPPPSRPPPIIGVKNELYSRWNSKSDYKGILNDSSPPFFDVEVDASSSAAASAAAMKEVMEKARAKLLSAKELMERKKEGVHTRSKTHFKYDMKEKEGSVSKMLERSNNVGDEKEHDSYEIGDNKMAFSNTDEMRKVTQTTEEVQVSLHGEKPLKVVHKSAERKFENHIDDSREWKEAAGFFEMKPDNSRKASGLVKNENIIVHVSGKTVKMEKDIAMEGLEQQGENDNKVNTLLNGHGLKKKGENVGNEINWQEDDNMRSLPATLLNSHMEYERSKVTLHNSQLEENEKKSKITHPSVDNKGIREADKSLKYEVRVEVKHNDNKGEVERNDNRGEVERNDNRGEVEQTMTQVNDKRKGKEVDERKDNENKLKETGIVSENEIGEIEGIIHLEMKGKLKGSFEKTEREKRLKKIHGQNGNDRWTEETFERLGTEKRTQDDFQEVNEVKPPKTLSEKVVGKRFNEDEENEKKLQDIHERWESILIKEKKYPGEKGSKKELEEVKNREPSEIGIKEAVEQVKIAATNDNTGKCVEDPDRGELMEVNGMHVVTECYEKSKKIKSTERAQVKIEMEPSRVFTEECEVDNENLAMQQHCKYDQCRETQGCFGNKESEDKIQLDSVGMMHQESDGDVNAFCRGDEDFIDAEFRVKPEDVNKSLFVDDTGFIRDNDISSETKCSDVKADTAVPMATNLKTSNVAYVYEELGDGQIRMQEEKKEPAVDESEKKRKAVGISNGHQHLLKMNSVPKVLSDPENQDNKSDRERGEQGKALNLKVNKEKFVPAQVVMERAGKGSKCEAKENPVSELKENNPNLASEVNAGQSTTRKDKIMNDVLLVEERGTERVKKEQELENDRLRKMEEEREREREREKDRIIVDKSTLEGRKANIETKAAIERAIAEAQQKAMLEARERLEKACAEAREKSLSGKALLEGRVKAERAAVERANAEARERAFEKAMAEKSVFESRDRMERSFSDKLSASSRNTGIRQSSSFSDIPDLQFQRSGSSSGSRFFISSSNGEISDGVNCESAQRCKARLERHRRTAERAAKALAEKNMRDLLTQREQMEKNRLAETLDADVRRWSSGKEGNLRALLSTLQYILGPESGWQPIPLTEVITAVAVKKAYRKATLCVHPDKLQQRSANIQQKYICEKVFDLLKEAWNKFNSEER